jgi:N-acetyl-gamma-glutamyl-phosphate reductase
MYPSLRGKVDLAFSSPDEAKLDQCDVVFFATPHGVAMEQAKELLDAGVRVIDLGADFRLQSTAVFQEWYSMQHAQPGLLTEAVYGLPEVNREAIRKARLIALPGCYPTSVILGYAPLLRQDTSLINEGALIADVKSGTSGAGRRAEVSMLLAEASDSFRAYGVPGHRHHPEIVQELQKIAGDKRKIGLTFVPHLVPMIRGIHCTLYATLLPQARETDFQKLYEDYYRADPFVDVMPRGSHPDTRSVRGSNYLRIAVHRPGNEDTLVILVVEDNLVKGASGQGVQCMNLMFDLDEATGLHHAPLAP